MSLNEAAYDLVRPLLDQPGLFGTSCHRRGGVWVVESQFSKLFDGDDSTNGVAPCRVVRVRR